MGITRTTLQGAPEVRYSAGGVVDVHAGGMRSAARSSGARPAGAGVVVLRHLVLITAKSCRFSLVRLTSPALHSAARVNNVTGAGHGRAEERIVVMHRVVVCTAVATIASGARVRGFDGDGHISITTVVSSCIMVPLPRLRAAVSTTIHGHPSAAVAGVDMRDRSSITCEPTAGASLAQHWVPPRRNALDGLLASARRRATWGRQASRPAVAP